MSDEGIWDFSASIKNVKNGEVWNSMENTFVHLAIYKPLSNIVLETKNITDNKIQLFDSKSKEIKVDCFANDTYPTPQFEWFVNGKPDVSQEITRVANFTFRSIWTGSINRSS